MEVSPMAAEKEIKGIKLDKYRPSHDDFPFRSIFCLKDRENIKEIEEKEECFILEFDPYDSLDYDDVKLFVSKNAEDDDLYIVGEKGQVACRDYPHSRHTCVTYPFDKTDHETHCELCYCYVCDIAAPCNMWAGTSGHCHAFYNEAWNKKRRLIVPADKQDFSFFSDIIVGLNTSSAAQMGVEF
ncbi:hypothetical protein Adt_18779 [Abeliophyllum distichum]|uniref:Uncharacterized protein n=1 Tax=Abeliophyllum distichum TaxID=126358 RepID=A0ABD1TKC4_9LAMI